MGCGRNAVPNCVERRPYAIARSILAAVRKARIAVCGFTTRTPLSGLNLFTARVTSTFRARSPSSTISCAIIAPVTFAISIRACTISSTGVAKNSLHIQAEAIDLRMPGIDTLKLRQAALALRRGGVGYYPHSDFIHVDVGRVRQWCFDCPASVIVGD